MDQVLFPAEAEAHVSSLVNFRIIDIGCSQQLVLNVRMEVVFQSGSSPLDGRGKENIFTSSTCRSVWRECARLLFPRAYIKAVQNASQQSDEFVKEFLITHEKVYNVNLTSQDNIILV